MIMMRLGFISGPLLGAVKFQSICRCFRIMTYFLPVMSCFIFTYVKTHKAWLHFLAGVHNFWHDRFTIQLLCINFRFFFALNVKFNVWSIKIRTRRNLSLWLYEYFWIILFYGHLIYIILKVLAWMHRFFMNETLLPYISLKFPFS